MSTLRWFREEYEAHVFERRCPALVCRGLIEFAVDQSMCKGCTLCAKKCPAGAITGAPKGPHVIVASRCLKCGICYEVCPVDAIRKTSEPDTVRRREEIAV
jgi:NADP-reducing hydrogenase subunit HndC